MKVDGTIYRTVSINGNSVCLINQNTLLSGFEIYESKNHIETCEAIKNMTVRGAGAIGAAAGYAMAQAFVEAPSKKFLDYVEKAKQEIESTRPTARDLFDATEKVFRTGLKSRDNSHRKNLAKFEAGYIAKQNEMACYSIGIIGNGLIANNSRILTHCNAGWLAFVDYGTALSPVYIAKRRSKKLHVYVSETRPRNQGASLTSWELRNEGIPFDIIVDSASAYLFSKGKIDMVIVGADRIAVNGDTANKIGTLEKAILANEFKIPFFVAAPTSTIDRKCKTGQDIVIEERSQDEVLYQKGLTRHGKLEEILVAAPGSTAINPAFDITPAKYITGIITEKGIIRPCENGINKIL